MSKEHLGELEELILLVILKLEKDAYGLAIRQEIIKQAQRSVTIGAVHGTVNRLEDKGLRCHRGEGRTAQADTDRDSGWTEGPGEEQGCENELMATDSCAGRQQIIKA